MKLYSLIEPLEARVAPATLNAAGTLLTYTDIDGDLVKVAFTKVAMRAEDFTFSDEVHGLGGSGPQSLLTVDLKTRTGAGFTLTATPHGGNGDSHANIENISGTDTDLGSIRVDGNVEFLSAGAAAGTVAGTGLKSFHALSMGRTGPFSSINGSLYRVGSFVIAGDMLSQDITFTGGVKTFTVGGNLGSVVDAASLNLDIEGGVGSFTIGGSVIGGYNQDSSIIIKGGTTAGTVKIGGSIIGGHTSILSGPQVVVLQALKSFTVGHDVRGGEGNGGGDVALGNVGTVKIGGSLIGSDDFSSSGYLSMATAGSITIGGDIQGGNLTGSGNVSANGAVVSTESIGSFKLGGDFIGGWKSGTGTYDHSSRIVAANTVGSMTFGGSITGSQTNPVVVSAVGMNTTGAALAIKSIKVKHSVNQTHIYTGWLEGLSSYSSGSTDAGIGSIVIGGNLSASQIIVGASLGSDNVPGTQDDLTIGGSLARLDSIKIVGAFTGIPLDTSHFFYIQAPLVKKVTIGKATYTHDALVAFVHHFDAIGKAAILTN